MSTKTEFLLQRFGESWGVDWTSTAAEKGQGIAKVTLSQGFRERDKPQRSKDEAEEFVRSHVGQGSQLEITYQELPATLNAPVTFDVGQDLWAIVLDSDTGLLRLDKDKIKLNLMRKAIDGLGGNYDWDPVYGTEGGRNFTYCKRTDMRSAQSFAHRFENYATLQNPTFIFFTPEAAEHWRKGYEMDLSHKFESRSHALSEIEAVLAADISEPTQG